MEWLGRPLEPKIISYFKSPSKDTDVTGWSQKDNKRETKESNADEG